MMIIAWRLGSLHLFQPTELEIRIVNYHFKWIVDGFVSKLYGSPEAIVQTYS